MNISFPVESKPKLTALSNASYNDLTTWAEAHTMIEYYLRKCIILSECDCLFSISQIGNQFSIHTSINLPLNTNIDLLNVKNKRNPCLSIIMVYMRLYEVLKPYCSLISGNFFNIEKIKSLHEKELSRCKPYDQISTTIKVSPTPLVIELNQNGYNNILDRAVKRHHNPLFISSSNFIYKSLDSNQKSEFHIQFDYKNSSINGAHYYENEEHPFHIESQYKEKALRIFRMGMIGNISSIIQAPSQDLYLSPYPTFEYTQEEVTASIKQFIFYEALIESEDGSQLKFHGTEYNQLILDALNKPCYTGQCFKNRIDLKTMENPSKPLLDKLIKSSLRNGYTLIKSEFKAKRHTIRCIDDIHYKSIHFTLASIRADEEKLLKISPDGSMIVVNIKLKNLTKQLEEIVITNIKGVQLNNDEANLLKLILMQGEHLYGRINKTQATYLIKQQLSKQYTILSELFFE